MPGIETIDDYLATVPEPARSSLEALRRAIREAAPEAVEAISYQVPAFKYRGRMLVSFGAAKGHASFFVQSPAVMDAHAEALEGYDTAKGTVRFPFDQPLPASLVKTLVRARVAENEKLPARR